MYIIHLQQFINFFINILIQILFIIQLLYCVKLIRKLGQRNPCE